MSGAYATTMKTFLIIGALLAILVLGYAVYTYLKLDPPEVLIDAVTHTDAPPPLPQGETAPLIAPAGFTATIFSRETPGVRVLARDPKGTLLASLTSEGKVIVLPDLDSDGVADEARVVLEGLKRPHGILVHCPATGNASADQDACRLYVAETGSLSSYAYDADLLQATNREELASLPTKGEGHYTRTLLLHPNGEELLISVGSSCNVCIEEDPHRAAVLSYNLTSKQLSVFATGLRNTVFMAVDPVKGEIWGTDNGRDVIGDDIPPDEVNIITQGGDYGWPYCYGKNIFDVDFNQNGEERCAPTRAAHIDLQAHSAALGIAFVPEEGWPEEMRNDVLLAYHGSWNRSVPTGYKVVRFDLEQTGSRSATSGPIDFLTGFLEEGKKEDEAIGRPVAILAEPGGVAYITDDRAGAIYRVTYDH
jgi:glucose/arabinose dehydrogenase